MVDPFDQIVSPGRIAETQTGLIDRDTDRRAAAFVATNFPDATPEQALEIARDAKQKLASISETQAAGKSLSKEESDRLNREGWMRFAETLPAGMGVAGAAVGSLPGGVVGAGLGAVAQSGINFLAGKDVTPRSAASNVRNKMATEMLGFSAVDATLGSIMRYFRGNKVVADEISAAFGAVGMRPSLQDISTTPMVEGGRNILGSLPLLNRPFKQRATAVAKDFQDTLDNYIEEVSPDVMLVRRLSERGSVEEAAALQEKLAEGVFDGAASGMEALRRTRDQRFAALKSIETQLEARAADAGVSLAVPSVNTRGRIGQTIMAIDDMTARVTTGALDEPAKFASTVDFIRNLSGNQISKEMTFSQLRRLKGRVSRQINEVRDDPTSVEFLTRVKEGIEEDMVVAASRHPDLQRAYDSAMEISEEFLTILSGMAVKRGKQINRGFGRQAMNEIVASTGETIQKGAGSRDVSTLVDVLADTSSPNEIRQFFGVLQQGMGKDRARDMIRLSLGKKIQRAAEAAFRESAEKAGDPSYTPGVLLKQLGLDTPNSKKFNATVALFEAAGISTKQTFAVSRVLDALFSVKNPRVAQFQQRQAALGGPKTVLRSATAGLLGGKASTSSFGLPSALAFYTIGRSYGKWITDPSRVRLVTTLADIRMPEHKRAQAAVSWVMDPYWWTSEDPRQAEMLKELQPQLQDLLSTKAGQKKFLQEIDTEFKFK